METTEKEAIALDGKVIDFKANKHGDIDSFDIEKDGKIIKIKFPPHTAQAVYKVAAKDDLVSLTYEEKKSPHDPKGDKKLKLLSLKGNSVSELIIGDLKPKKPAVDQKIQNLNFDDFELLKGKKGELTGIRSGNQLVHIHREDEEIAGKITPDSKLEITAVKRTYDGFINEKNDDVFHIRKIIIDGHEYPSKK